MDTTRTVNEILPVGKSGADSADAGSPASQAVAAADAVMPPPTRAKRGFAVLSPEKKREIARMGGKAAHEHGRAHRFTSEEARAAGKKRHQLRMMAAAAAASAPGPGAGSATPAPVTPGTPKR